MKRRKNNNPNLKASTQTVKKNKKRVVPKKLRTALKYSLALFVIVSLGLVLSLTVLFKVDKIEVVGESRYDNNSIISVSELKTGKNLFLSDTKKGVELIEKNMPYLEGVKIKRVIPAKLLINVKESNIKGLVELDGKYIAISSSGKVLDILNNELQNTTIIKGIKVSSADLALKMNFKDQVQEQILGQLTSSIEKNGLDSITGIDLSNTVDIILNYDNRINITLGTSNDMDYKIRTAVAILKDKIAKEEKGTLNVSLAADDNRSYFTPDY